MKTRSHHGGCRHCLCAFTLIEFIGVLAVITILVGLTLPSIIRRIDEAAKRRELSDLNAIHKAVKMGILQSRTISLTNWAQGAANWSMMSASKVIQTPRGITRQLYSDPGCGLFTSTIIQTVDGFTNIPSQARLMLVSAIASPEPPAPPATAAAFEDVWNTPNGSIPSAWTSWTGRGDDVVVQRMNLAPLFHRVVLFNRSSNTVGFAIDRNTAPTGIPPNAPVRDVYYLDGSVLGLYASTNYATTNLLLTEVINRDISRVFEGGIWRDQIGPGPYSPIEQDFDNLAYAFLTSASPPSSKRGDNVFGVADMLIAYMTAYASWANMNPCFSFLGKGNNKFVPEYVLLDQVTTCFGNPGNGSCAIVP